MGAVPTVPAAPAFASVSEAMDMARAALGYLAAADAAQLSAETQAQCLRDLERTDAISTAPAAAERTRVGADQFGPSAPASATAASSITWTTNQPSPRGPRAGSDGRGMAQASATGPPWPLSPRGQRRSSESGRTCPRGGFARWRCWRSRCSRAC